MWKFVVILSSMFLMLVNFCTYVKGTQIYSTDADGKNWRNIQETAKRKQRNKKAQKVRLLKLRKLNEDLLSKIGSNISSSPHIPALLFGHFEDQVAIGVSPKEGTLEAKCSFIAADCSMEVQEQEAVSKLITPSDSVLELGARFGTTSCTIAKYLNNSGKLVAVEPDPDVWNILARNQELHHCNFWTFRGVVSHHPIVISSAEYATRATSVTPHYSQKQVQVNTIIPHIDFLSLQEQVGFYFTALLIDCEGCIDQLFEIPPSLAINEKYSQEQYLRHILHNVSTIIIETDMKENTPHCESHCVNYGKWFSLFSKLGYRQVFHRTDSLFPFIDHVAYRK